MIRRSFVVVSVLGAMLACSCTPTVRIGAGAEEGPRRFELTPTSGRGSAPVASRTDGGESITTVAIPRPEIAPSLDRDRISVRVGSYERQSLAGARWTDRVGTILQVAVLETFERSPRTRAVREDFSGVSSVTLRIDVREFAADLDPERDPAAHVEMHAQLVDTASPAIIAARSFSVRVPIEGAGAQAIVAALDRATGEVLSDLRSWVRTALG